MVTTTYLPFPWCWVCGRFVVTSTLKYPRASCLQGWKHDICNPKLAWALPRERRRTLAMSPCNLYSSHAFSPTKLKSCRAEDWISLKSGIQDGNDLPWDPEHKNLFSNSRAKGTSSSRSCVFGYYWGKKILRTVVGSVYLKIRQRCFCISRHACYFSSPINRMLTGCL